MVLQNRLEIKGKSETYLIIPTDSASVLKPNGEICSTYLGLSKELGRKVVVKRYHPWVNSSPAYFWRIHREAETTATCSGLNSELLFFDGVYYLVTDYVDGVSFKDLTRWRYHRQLNYSDLITLSVKALLALDRVHRAGFVHCDIKPSNIIVTSSNPKSIVDGDVKIIDFGMARKPAEALHQGERELPFALIYSAPEQVLNLWELIGFQTDIYSLGVTLWQLFARVEPWQTSNPLKTIHVQLTQNLPKSNKVPDDLMAILNKATSKIQLPKPPHFYTHSQLVELERHAIGKRYNSISQMVIDFESLKAG
ncbi:MAG: serine/threonine-protein kinase [Bacteroidota bacterium]